MIRQYASYLIIGVLQFLVDSAVYGFLVTQLGVPFSGNLASRFVAAVIGYILNACFTFRAKSPRSGRRNFLRYFALWSLMTVISTIALFGVGWLLGGDSHSTAYLAAKITVELFLSLASFAVMKFWVFKNFSSGPRHGVE